MTPSSAARKVGRPLTRRWLLAAATVAVLVGAVVSGFAAPARGYDLPIGDRAADPAALVYAYRGALWIDGKRHRIDPPPQRLVSTDGGIYYTADSHLYRWDAHGERSEQVAEVGPAALTTSADGRWLGFIDYRHGPRGLHGDRVAEAVAFDTRTGQQVVRDRAGMGGRGDDLAYLYEDATPNILGFDEGRLEVAPPTGEPQSIDLGNGHRRPTRRHVPVADTAIGTVGVLRPAPGAGGRYAFARNEGNGGLGAAVRSFDGATTAYADEDGFHALRVGPDGYGRLADLSTPGSGAVLAGWADDETFYGYVEHRVGTSLLVQVVTCSPVRGSCTPVSRRLPADTRSVVFANTDWAF